MIDMTAINVLVNHQPLLTDINLRIKKGLLVGLVGPNGAGKTTLMKVVSKLLSPTTGECRLFGKPIHSIKANELARKLGYLPQSVNLSWPLTVEQIVQLGRIPFQQHFSTLSSIDIQKVEMALEVTETLELRNRVALTLSGGELTRVMLARVLATEPDVIIADEPIASLDPYHQLHVLEILRQYCHQSCTAIISLHDLNFARRFCDYVILMQGGRIIAKGLPSDVLSLSNIESAYHIHMKWLKDENNQVMLPLSRINPGDC